MKNPILYKLIKPLVYIWFYPIYHPQIINKDAIPKTGRAILAGNHTNPKDVFLLGASTKRTIRFLAKSELLTGATSFFFKNMGLIPVNRNKVDNSVIPLSVKLLEDEHLIAIFPEGTINKTKDIILAFKAGAVKMAIDSNSPIIPFAITGKYTKFKKNVKISYGELYFPKTNNVEQEINVLENKVIKLINDNGEKL